MNEFYQCKTFANIYLRSFYECEITVSKKVAVFFFVHEFCSGAYGALYEEYYGGGGVVVVCYTATFSVVMQCSSPQTASEN